MSGCEHEAVIDEVGPMLHITCQCGLDYWVVAS
jgi:hypothetical protein